MKIRANSSRKVTIMNMNPFKLLLLTVFFVAGSELSQADITAERADAVRLQIYLDSQNFGPGYIDGRPGRFTQLAVETYNRSKGRPAEDMASVQTEALAAVKQAFTAAVVPPIVSKFVDSSLPTARSEQAKRKSMPYRSVGEFMAERYHTSIEFLELLNGKSRLYQALEGTTLLVPNVTPFKIEEMSVGRGHKEDPAFANRRISIDTSINQIRFYATPKLVTPNTDPENTQPAPPKALIVQDGDLKSDGIAEIDSELIAAFPITPGQEKFIRYGLWEVKNLIEMPVWRFDDSLLKTGKRSNVALNIPGGPNNPVGVVWMGLNRPGIGVHGTSSPETIGRSRSAGCVRMANWDAVRLPTLARPGVKVWLK